MAEQENAQLRIAELRALVADTEDPDGHIADDEDVLRFLLARSTIEKSAQMLRTHLTWRKETKPWRSFCPACDETPGYHALRQIGFDVEGRAIVYTCFDQCADGIGFKNGAEHLTYAIENAILAMKKYDQKRNKRGDGKWVWILDYAGFGFKNMSVASSKEPLALLQAHYPERLHKVVMLNAPWIFGGFFVMLKPFVDAKTYAKAAFVRGSPEEVDHGLQELGICGDVASWLLVEMERNRRTPYPEEQRQFWMKPEGSNASGGESEFHDPRGPASWIKEYVESCDDRCSQIGSCVEWEQGMPSPMMVELLTGRTIHAHYNFFDEQDEFWYDKSRRRRRTFEGEEGKQQEEEEKEEEKEKEEEENNEINWVEL
jgi:hypothetical protein